MSSWFRVVEWPVRRELSVWNLCFPKRQFDLHWYVPFPLFPTFVLRTAATACSSQCGTCVGAADFCLTCNGGQLASGGKCVSSCPSNTITTAGTCTSCHPDCATCSGTSFNQCSSCPSNRPVLSNG